MKRIFLFLSLLAGLFAKTDVRADEGMWLPHLIQSQNYEEMVRLGLKLTPEQIFDVNNSSLKDAIVRLGPGFCTGEMISAEGLMLTNHHCGYGSIQSLSSTANNYLRDGFWAMKRSDELSAGFSVSFLVRIEDVTDRVTEGLTDATPIADRRKKIGERAKEIEGELAEKTKHITGTVKSFFEGNKYYAFVYQTYPDVRLVGTPPESLGKYGGDTDNWMWPRHTADFSMFRVYADKDNNPAEYSVDNVPYRPKHHLPVSIKGVEKGDYAMIFGYPGSTDRYLTSYGVKFATDVDFPARVKVRRAKLDIYEAYQAQSDQLRLQYADKHAGVSNYWKNFMGQTRGLKRLNIYERKKGEEIAFMQWVEQDNTRKEMYGDVIKLYEKGFEKRNKYELARTYLNEAIFGIESFAFAANFIEMDQAAEQGGDISELIESLKNDAKEFYKDYHNPLDREVCAAMLKFYSEDIDPSQQPPYFKSMVAKFKGDFNKMAEYIFAKSFLVDAARTEAFLNKPNVSKLRKDPVYKFLMTFYNHYFEAIRPSLNEANDHLSTAKRLYVKGLIEMNPAKKYSADANSTMRMTYGSILDYYPADAVHYAHFTTLKGVLEKYVPGDLEFDLKSDFIAAAKKGDYGQYADKDGELHVCFLSNNDITGGNSGSPVINGEGHLIGTAFDGNWEAMSGDIAFEPALQRTISVDIRYTLWIIDIYAKAGHLVDEMTIVR